MRKTILTGGVALLTMWLLCAPAWADFTYHVSMNTNPLIGHPAGPFSLDFQLIDGDGVAGNTVTLSNFDFGGGSPTGIPLTQLGGVSGDLSGSVTLTDSAFLNEFEQGFSPGSLFSFDLTTTSQFAGGTPDGFSLAILDNTASELPTLSSSGAFLQFDLSGGQPVVNAFASDSSQAPVGGGDPIDIAAPTVQITGSGNAPEPGTLGLMGVGCLAFGVGAGRFRRVRKG